MIQGAAYRILYLFVDTDVLGFADICRRVDYGTDLGGYYLRSLIRDGYLTKTNRGQYHITRNGREKLAVTIGGKHGFVSRPRPAIIIIAKKEEQYAILRRTKQPFIGVSEWPARSILKGERMTEAASQTLHVRFGVDGIPVFLGMFRRIDTFGSDIFDDKLFAVHTFTVPIGMSIDMHGETGDIMLLDREELETAAHRSKSLVDILLYAEDKSRLPYMEQVYQLSEADLVANE